MKDFIPDNPTYSFNVGDQVVFGGFESTKVLEVSDDKRIYKVEALRKGSTSTHEIGWTDLRPYSGESDLTRNKDIRLSFTGGYLEDLLSTYYCSRIDLNPEYQRDYVWEDEDRVALIDSVFHNISIGRFVLVHNPYTSDYGYQIVDGKQRLMTLLAFYENRFPYQGYYYNDLSAKDRNTFRFTEVIVSRVENMSKKDIYRLFLMLNTAGRVVDKSHLDYVRNLYEEECKVC